MKRISSLKEMTRLLANGNYKIAVNVDDKPAFDGHLKTQEIKETYGSIKSFLESVIEDSDPKVITVQYGLTNGSSWKNPRWMFIDLQAKNSEKERPAQRSFRQDPYGLNGIATPNETMDSLQFKLLFLNNELERHKNDASNATRDKEDYKRKLEEQIEEVRSLKHKLQDLELEHKREISSIQKPSMIDKLLEKPEVAAGIMDLISSANVPKQGLNGAPLSDYGNHVVQVMQKHANIDRVLARVLKAMNTNKEFTGQLMGLLNRIETATEQEITVNAE